MGGALAPVADHRLGIWGSIGIQILPGSAAAQVLPIRKGLAVFHQRQVDVDVADHFGNRWPPSPLPITIRSTINATLGRGARPSG